MEIEFAYTLANENVRLQFLAMERSLRSAGFDLPIRVFPYNSHIFDLPKGSSWETSSLHRWLTEQNAQPMCCKYHCLTKTASFFTDVDIIYLRDPREVLAPVSGFVVADTEWNKPQYTYNEESKTILARRSSLWLKSVFNGGFFACENALYSEEELTAVVKSPSRRNLLLFTDDQIGLNVLVSESGATVTNLNLPPSSMESTWAGDYPGEYQTFWQTPESKPLFIHWAGPLLDQERQINQIFYDFLTKAELAEWHEMQRIRLERLQRQAHWPLGVRILNNAVKILYPKYYVQPRPFVSKWEP